MIKLWSVLLSLVFVACVSAQDLTIVPNYINGIRINGALLDDLSDIEGGGPAGAAGGHLTGTYPNPSIATGAVNSAALEDLDITPGICGDATNVPQIDWDINGRGLTCTQIPIEFPVPEAGSITPTMLESVVVAGTCGDSTNVCRITYNTKGQITVATEEAISGEPTGGIGPEELESTAVTPGTCGDATNVCRVTTDEDGRITGQTAVAIDFPTESTAPEFTSAKLTPVVETTSCNMAFANHQISPSGTTTCTLPAAATDTVGTYNFYHMNGNNLVIAKTGSDKINDVSANMTAITGPLSHIQCTNVDDVDDWRCSVTSLSGYGSPWSLLCSVPGGGTNTASSGFGGFVEHSSSCTLPSGKLTVGTVLETCSWWKVATGAAPPALSVRWTVGATPLNVNTQPTIPAASLTRNFQSCAKTMVLETPNAAADTVTTIAGNLDDITALNPGGGFTPQPVVIDTSGTVTITQWSRWGDPGGAPSSAITQLGMTVFGAGLLP